MYVISLLNMKGGVGKTTTSVNLAAWLSEKKRKTLLVDLDPQANATSMFVDGSPTLTTSDLIKMGCSLPDAAVKVNEHLMKRSSNKVTSESAITGKAGTTKISASYTLERLVDGKYIVVDSWTASSNSMILSNSHNTQDCPAGTYKLSVTATVTRNGTTEEASDSLVKKL